MKKSKIFILSIFAIATLTFSFTKITQKGKSKKREEARKEVQAYMKENVLPVILKDRKEFESKLSNNEKSTLSSLRERLVALDKKRKSMERPEGEPTEAQKKAFQDMQKEKRHIMTAAWEIVDNHESELEAIQTENKVNKEKWHNDIKAILEKYKPEGKEGGEFSKGKKGRKMGKGRHGMKMMQMHKPVMFVLMDPSKSVDELAADMEKRQNERKEFRGQRGGHHKGNHDLDKE